MAREHDVSLRERVGCGQESTFAAIFEEYHVRICRYLLALVRDPDLAEDLAQDTFVKAYKALIRSPTPRLPQQLNAWLYAIATNTALSVIRRRKLIAWLPIFGNTQVEQAPSASSFEARVAERGLLMQALNQLSKADAACLRLRFQEGLSYAEIAEVLGTSLVAAKMCLSRARAAFREVYLRLGEERQEVDR